MGEKSKKSKAFLDRLDYYRTLPHKCVGMVGDIDNWHCEVLVDVRVYFGMECFNEIGIAGNESSIKFALKKLKV